MKKKLFFILFLSCFVYTSFAVENIINDKINNISQIIEQILDLSQKIKETPKKTSLYISKAELEISIGNYIEAKNSLSQAINIEKENIKILNLLGLVSYNLYQFNEAYNYFKQVLNIDKNNQFASYYSGVIKKNSEQNKGQQSLTNRQSEISPIKKDRENEILKDSENNSSDTLQNIDFLKKFNNTYNDSKSEYIGLDSVVISNSKQIIIKDEKSNEYTIHCFIKILNDNGINKFRDFLYSYNSNEYTPLLERGGTYNEELEFTSVNNKNVMLIDRKERDYSYIYSDGKYISFPFPNLKVGSIIEYKINFKPTGNGIKTNFIDSFLFCRPDTKIIEANYSVIYNKDLPLKIHKSRDYIIEREFLGENNLITKTFTQKNIPPYNLQGETVNIYSVAPFVLISTYTNWDDIAKWYFSKFKEKNIIDEIVVNNVIKTIPNFLNKTKIEKIDELFQYVQKNIEYVGIELKENIIFPHTPKEVFDNKFGDCKDQANFLLALLKSQNIEAYPVLVSTKDNISVLPHIPGIEYFNHMILFVPSQKGIDMPLYLDSTEPYNPYNNIPIRNQGGDGFFMDPTGYKLISIPTIPYEKNLFEESFVVKTDEIGSGEVFYEEKATGSFSSILRSSYPSNVDNNIVRNTFYTQQKKNYQELDIKNVIVEGFDKQSGDIRLSFTSNEKKLIEVYFDGRLVIKYNSRDIASLFNFPDMTRYDFTANFLFNYKKKIEYIFPEGYVVTKNNISNFTRSNSYIDFTFNADKLSENRLLFNIDVKLKRRIIDSRDIEELGYFIGNIAYLANFELTLENKNLDFEKFYEKLASNYNQKDVYDNYVKVLLEKKEYEEALKILDKAISNLEDNNSFYITKASILFELGRYSETEKILDILRNKNSKDISVYYYYIDLFRKTNNDDKLEKILLEAYSKFDSEEYIVTSLTNLYIQKNDYKEAINFVQKVLEKHPNSSNYHATLGYIYSVMKDFSNAESALLESIRLNEKNGLALNNLAWLYCENDINIILAIEYAKKACSIDPKNEAYLDTLAESYYKNGEYDLAITTIKEAIRLSPHQTYLQQQLDKMEKTKQKK